MLACLSSHMHSLAYTIILYSYHGSHLPLLLVFAGCVSMLPLPLYGLPENTIIIVTVPVITVL